MSGIEQDQEKMMNAVSQASQNALYTVTRFGNLGKPKTNVEIKTAKDAVQKTQELLTKGTKFSDIKNYLANTSLGQNIIKASGNIENFARLIMKKADINNKMSNNSVSEKSNKITKKL